MGKGFRIAKVFGITIRIDWSWLFILALIAWNLATAFGETHLNWGFGLSGWDRPSPG